MKARARAASGEERAWLRRIALTFWPPCADQQRKPEREIPVVVPDPPRRARAGAAGHRAEDRRGSAALATRRGRAPGRDPGNGLAPVGRWRHRPGSAEH
jgi:hypothetical protein